MSAIIRKTARVENAANFIKDFYSGTNNYLYALISMSTDWTENEVPVDENASDASVWADVLGAVRVTPDNFCPVIPKTATTNWTYGTTYDIWTEEVGVIDNNCVVMNQYGEVFVLVVGAVASTVEPVFYTVSGSAATDSTYFNDGLQSIITTQSGALTWKYLYRLPAHALANLDRSDFLPVNYGVNRWTNTLEDQYTKSQDAITIDGANGYAHKVLGAKQVLIRALFDNDLDVGITYRQISLVKNPLESGGSTRASDSFYSDPATELEASTGSILYIDNRYDVERVTDQTEEFKRVISF